MNAGDSFVTEGESQQMAKSMVVYVVQPYWWDGRRLARAEARQFRSEDEAWRGAEASYAHYAGVALYLFRGFPDGECWSGPLLLRTIGHVPDWDEIEVSPQSPWQGGLPAARSA